MRNIKTKISHLSVFLASTAFLILCGCASQQVGLSFEQRTKGLYQQGTELYNDGNYIQAIYLLNQAIEFNPQFAEAYYVRGLTYLKLDSLETATEDLEKARELPPVTEKPGYDEADIDFQLALADMARKNYDIAEEGLKKAIA